MDLTSTVDVVVIGAGPAGSATAALLHKAGLSVQVVEKQRFPRFVIGESLLPRCMETLEEAGLLEAVRAQDFQVKRGATFLQGDARCGFDFGDQFTEGWTWTWQVPRDAFDKALTDALEARGVPIAWGHGVVDLTVPDAGYDPTAGTPGPTVTVEDEHGERATLHARWIVDASGWGRVLPRALGLDVPSGQAFRRAVFTHVTGDRRPPGDEGGRIWVCIHPEGAWIWIIPFKDGRTSVGVVAPDAFWEGRPTAPTEALFSALREEPSAWARLSGATPAWPARELKGYSSMVSRVHGPGYVLVGNATEFLDPVFSSGVTLALESARMASRTLVAQLGGQAVDWDAAYATPLEQGVDVFRTYVDTWYDGTLPELFFSDDGGDSVFRPQICSVLAGYVWDQDNPFVRHHARRVRQAHRMVMRHAPQAPAT